MFISILIIISKKYTIWLNYFHMATSGNDMWQRKITSCGEATFPILTQ